MPGVTECIDLDSHHTCDGGGEWGPPQACDPGLNCADGDCANISCELAQANPSNLGCSFLVMKLDAYSTDSQALYVVNPSADTSVNAQLYQVNIDGNQEVAAGGVVQLPAQGLNSWMLTLSEIETVSLRRQGGVYRLETDRPVAAFLHAPLVPDNAPEASLLLPEHTLTGNYVVASSPTTLGQYSSYFTAMGTTGATTVSFSVQQPTLAGDGVPALVANGSTQIMLDRYQVLNVVGDGSGSDLSGAVINADQPIWLVGGNECANVPSGEYFACDTLLEVMFPLETWGQAYVAAHAPTRANEPYYWRVYAGADAVTITSSPAQQGFPLQLDEGQFHAFSATGHFTLTGDGPFLPVQLLAGGEASGGIADPAMIQAVPTEQFLDNYAFVTAGSYDTHYAQVVRSLNGAAVTLNGQPVGGFTPVGNYEVASVVVTEGPHFAVSDDPFGLYVFGYKTFGAYGYPGGLALEHISP
jgi:hypothetical protein